MVMETVMNQMMDENKARTKNEIQGEIFYYAALYRIDTEGKKDVLPSMHPLMASKATSDPDPMYLHQAMKEPDRANFLTAILQEVTDQVKNEHSTVVKQNQVPKESTILPCVWQMRRKRDIITNGSNDPNSEYTWAHPQFTIEMWRLF